MVFLRERNKGNNKYYYLEHSYKDKGKVKKISLYLGSKKPDNIEELKKDFMKTIYRKRFLKDIDKIKINFNKNYKKFPKSSKEKSKENFAIKFTYNSQKIEGSTLSLKETANLLEKGLTPENKSLEDVKEAKMHEKVFFEMLEYKKDLNLQIILKWHKVLFSETKKDIAGKIRNYDVGIAQSKFKPPMHLELDVLLKEFFDWHNKQKKKIHPVELAALIHLKFVTIHPFADGNGRISRLIMNFILKKHNFPLLDIPYSKRTSYYNALERSQVNKQEEIFVQWFFRRYLEIYKRHVS